MRQVLGIVMRSDNGSSPQDRRRLLDVTIERARAQLGWTCPVLQVPESETLWSPAGHIAVLGWQNEQSDPNGSMLWEREDAAAWLLGYTTLSDGGDELLKTPTMRLVGNRAIQLHFLAQSELQETDDPARVSDVPATRQLAAAGFYLGESTPWIGVTATHISSLTSIAPDEMVVRVADVGVASVEPTDPVDWSETVEAVAAALVAAFDPIPLQRVRVGVTGGRDSRLIAAALSRRPDVDASLFISGHEDTPDVILGGQVAQHPNSRPVSCCAVWHPGASSPRRSMPTRTSRPNRCSSWPAPIHIRLSTTSTSTTATAVGFPRDAMRCVWLSRPTIRCWTTDSLGWSGPSPRRPGGSNTSPST